MTATEASVDTKINTTGGKAPAAGGNVTIVADLPGVETTPEVIASLAVGARLRTYAFDRYKTKRKEGEEQPGTLDLTLAVDNPAAAKRAWAR